MKLYEFAAIDGIGRHDKGVGPVAHKDGESHINLAAGARLDDLDLQPNGARICASVAKATSMSRMVRVHFRMPAPCTAR